MFNLVSKSSRLITFRLTCFFTCNILCLIIRSNKLKILKKIFIRFIFMFLSKLIFFFYVKINNLAESKIWKNTISN